MKRTRTPALGYLRVSSKGQIAGDKDGMVRQRANVERFARMAGYDVIEWYEDAGVSGTTELENRPGLEAAVTRIAANGVRVMLLENSDRLARDLMVQEAIIKAFLDLRAQIITTDGYDLTADDESRVFIRQVMGAASQFAKRLLVRRMREARQRKRAKGTHVEGIRPFGTVADEAVALERIRQLHKARVSLTEIAATLNAEGFPTRSQRIHAVARTEKSRPPMPWSKQTVAKIVRRDFAQQTKPRKKR